MCVVGVFVGEGIFVVRWFMSGHSLYDRSYNIPTAIKKSNMFRTHGGIK